MSTTSGDQVEIDPEKDYTTTEAAEIIGLSYKQVGRLVDAGLIPGSGRKSPIPGSPRVIPGTALSEYMRKNK